MSLMNLFDIQRAITTLPPTLPTAPNGEDSGPNSPGGASGPLRIVSKQGRLILRLLASLEALEARYKELAEGERARREQAEAAAETLRNAERRARQIALEAIHLMDALDWVSEATRARGDEKLVTQIASAQRDCLRRLAVVGITEIPAQRGSAMDGRLHEGLEAVGVEGAEADIARYHIVSLLRRGYQLGTDILRRAGVATAA